MTLPYAHLGGGHKHILPRMRTCRSALSRGDVNKQPWWDLFSNRKIKGTLWQPFPPGEGISAATGLEQMTVLWRRKIVCRILAVLGLAIHKHNSVASNYQLPVENSSKIGTEVLLFIIPAYQSGTLHSWFEQK